MLKAILNKNKILEAGILFPAALLIGFFIYLDTKESFYALVCLSLSPAIFYVLFFARKLILPTLVFLIPLSVNWKIGGGTQIEFPAEPLLGIVALTIFLHWSLNHNLSKSVLKHPLTILILLEICWMIFCSVNGELPVVSYKRCVVRLSYVVVFYFLFYKWFEKKENQPKLFFAYAFGSLIPVFLTLYHHAQLGFSPISAYLMPRPFFEEHTIYGASLAFLLPMFSIILFRAKEFSISGIKHFGLFLLTMIIACAEFLSYSRAAWISVGAAAIFGIFLFFRIRYWMILTLLFFGGIIVFQNYNPIMEMIKRNESVSNKGDASEHLLSVTNLQSDASNLERVNRWKCAIRMAEEKPIMGFGPGSYQFVYGRFQSRVDMTRISTFSGSKGHAHSEIFNSLSETGIPGMLIYMVIMFSVIGYGMKIIYNSKEKREKLIAIGALLGLITFYVHGFFNAFSDTEKMAVLVLGSIAILVSIDIQQRRMRNSLLQNKISETN